MEGKGKKRRINIGGFIAVAIVLVAAIVRAVFFDTEDSVVIIHSNDQSAVYVNNNLVDTLDGLFYSYQNLDGSVHYITQHLVNGGDIYILKGRKLEKIEGVTMLMAVAAHSQEALFFDEENKLYRYDGSKLEKISDKFVEHAVISGNGKYYAYTTEDGAYFGTNPDDETEVKDVNICGISKDAKYIYATTGNAEFEDSQLVLVDKNGETKEIADEVMFVTGFNADGTEIMFVAGEGEEYNTYVSEKGKEPVEIAKGWATTYYEGQSLSALMTFYPVDTFEGTAHQVYYDDEWKFNVLSNKYEAGEVVDNFAQIVGIDEKFSKVFYLDADWDLYCSEIKEDAEEERLAKNIGRVTVSTDGKSVYYIESDENRELVQEELSGELCYIKGNSEPEEVDEFENVQNLVASENGVYVVTDEETYYVEGTNVKELDERVDVFVEPVSKMIYGYNDDGAYKLDGSKMKELKSGVDKPKGYECVKYHGSQDLGNY